MKTKAAAIALGLALLVPQTASAETVLRVGTFLSPQGVWHGPLEHLIETVNGKDTDLKLELVADPSSISPFQLGDAVSGGVIDMAYLSGAFYTNLVPEADANKLFNVPVAELRENGAMNLIDQIHRDKMGALFLGKMGDGIKYHIYTNRSSDEPRFEGWDMRGTPLYRPFMEALGANVIQMQGSEVYSAMESGVVDGYAWPLWGIGDLGLLEVTDYRVEPGFYNAEISVLFNEDKWNSLTEEQQDTLRSSVIETEEWFIDYRNRVDEEQRRLQADAGIEAITFSEEQSQDYVRMADEAGWAVVIENSPELGPQIKELTYTDKQ
ncbi:TRAP transporter substrate-binding protein DctP [Amorphus orientalis]|uniref:TRAP-type C4-dicarboxylate transport system substrate-binding protein n=1 Tax=Amorphus orientalis TaxID=649198 RepID=A0AAE4ARS0_9HYPH|nr:TRAP transporter substrate-binding protein DctP [Amorphus orientalis]MDQ0314487.1 TRAP-type C4-dicarboxylate transport system substrate-binding protein [Amorphus orientalis]